MNATHQDNHGGFASSSTGLALPKSTKAVPPGPPGASKGPEQPFSAFGSLSQFKDAQRMAMMLAQASIVPECYRGEGQIGDWVIALEIANRIRGLGAGGDAELENGSGQTWLVSAISHLVRQRDKTLLAYPLSNDRNARGR